MRIQVRGQSFYLIPGQKPSVALGKTERRRAVQLAYNEELGTTPISIVKGVSDIAEFLQLENPNVPAEELRLEYAAKLRDEIKKLRRELVALVETTA